MNAKILYDSIPKMAFSNYLLMGLLSFIDLRTYPEANIIEDSLGEEKIGIDILVKPNPEITKEKVLFKNNCAMCHNRNLKDELIGPALGKVSERWKDYPSEDLFKWIRKAQALIVEGQKALFAEYKTVMNTFTNLTEEEIALILKFCDK